VKSGWLVSGAPALAALEPHEPVDRESPEVAIPKSDPAPPEPNWLAAVGGARTPMRTQLTSPAIRHPLGCRRNHLTTGAYGSA
jgi:hypothetical protein